MNVDRDKKPFECIEEGVQLIATGLYRLYDNIGMEQASVAANSVISIVKGMCDEITNIAEKKNKDE